MYVCMYVCTNSSARAGYFSLPPTRQDLTQIQWPGDRLKWGLGEGKVGHEPRLEPCWTMMQLAHPKVGRRSRGPYGLKSAFDGLCPYQRASPLHVQDKTQGQFLSRVWQIWIQSFPSPRLVAILRLKKFSLCYYLFIAGGMIVGFIPFPRLLVLCRK